VNNNDRITSWSLRDNPLALAAAAVAVVTVILIMGWLAVRIGTIWVRAYVHRHIEADE